MRYFFTLFLLTCSGLIFCQPSLYLSDTLIHVVKNPAKGFYSDYLLFVTKGTPCQEQTYLLVEPNNTGEISDDDAIHLNAAIALASRSSVGNNVAAEVHIPLLVPVFPRPASQPLMYTHALDRDVILDSAAQYKRLDLQLLKMIADAKEKLNGLNIHVADKFFMTGFSASATFVNRFSIIHPEKIQALAIGGFNGELMLPVAKLDGQPLPYPLGTSDFKTLFGKEFDLDTYRLLPKYIYMGALDTNDAVQFDDAYSADERAIINKYLAADVQSRYLVCQKLYQQHGVRAEFKTVENVGHGTTGSMNLDAIRFFMAQMKK